MHKQHHSFRTPVGIASVYAHPLEDLVVNLGSFLVGPLLRPAHVAVWLCLMHGDPGDGPAMAVDG